MNTPCIKVRDLEFGDKAALLAVERVHNPKTAEL